MTRRFYSRLFLAGLAMALVAALFEQAPGYMDADYYYAGGLMLANGQAATEPYIWNYLNNPASLPAPSFSYWMPLVSLIAAAGIWLARPLGFLGARLGFILLAACIPGLTSCISYHLTHKPASARLAGILALFPGFYLAYLPTSDAFAVYMVLGALFILLAFTQGDLLDRVPMEVRLLGLGILAGFFHLTRADGLMWLAAAGIVGLALWIKTRQTIPPARRGFFGLRLISFAVSILAGYGLVMSAWFDHNLKAWGSLLPPGGFRAVWITAYEQTMLYPASLLTPEHWLAAGWSTHLKTWLDALLTNLQTSIAVQGSIVLFPFILFGLWELRRRPEIRLGAFMYLATAAAMTLVFPFAGMNGGFFHSGAAFQPLFWAVAPVGIETAMQRYTRWRRLGQPQRMVRFMSTLAVIVVVLLSGLIYVQRVFGRQPGVMAWSSSAGHYQDVEKTLVRLGAQPGEAVLVNNPPGYWLASGRSAVVIPDGDEQMLLMVARKFDVRYVVLEVTNPTALGNLYHGRVNPDELKYLTSVGTTRLYQINLPVP